MKKSLTFIAVLALANAVQAASLNWNITSVLSPTTGEKADGYLAYLFITEQNVTHGTTATTTTIQAVKDLIESGAEYYTEGDNKYLKKGDDKIQIAAMGTSVSGGISGATGYNGNNFDKPDSLKAFAVIFDANTLAGAKNYIVTAEKSASWTSSTGARPLAFGNQSGATWTPVPEPSTAVLALAGLALLLKRRRA